MAEKRYYKLSRPLQAKFDSAAKDLEISTDPRKLGTFKRSKRYNAYFYDPSSSVRLAYNVSFENKLIVILDVGDHKQVYGKD